ncbi:MAG: LemA family protein, partial [Isosphaeraceae bacterium]
QSFPSNLVASAMGFGERTYFQLDEAERAAPRVEFDSSVKVGTSTGTGAGTDKSTPASSSPGQSA